MLIYSIALVLEKIYRIAVVSTKNVFSLVIDLLCILIRVL